MLSIFEKLNLKEQREIVVLNAPVSFEGALRTLHDLRILRRMAAVRELTFALTFVIQQTELDKLSKATRPRPQAMHSFGSPIRRVPQGDIRASSIVTKGGMYYSNRASIACARLQLTRIGPLSDFAEPSSSIIEHASFWDSPAHRVR
jgi:hypothetical protein